MTRGRGSSFSVGVVTRWAGDGWQTSAGHVDYEAVSGREPTPRRAVENLLRHVADDAATDAAAATVAEVLRALVGAADMPNGERPPRRFVLRRDRDATGVSGVGIVAEGVEFSDGVVALRWLVPAGQPGHGYPTSVVFHDRGMESVARIHGHQGATRIVWLDGPDAHTGAGPADADDPSRFTVNVDVIPPGVDKPPSSLTFTIDAPTPDAAQLEVMRWLGTVVDPDVDYSIRVDVR